MPYNLLMPEEKQKPQWIPPWLWQRRWWILGTLFILVWWLVPPLLYRRTGADAAARLKAITDTRTALLAGLIGVGALLTFWLNSRMYRITAQTLDLDRQGQITERYTKAIEQLGDEELAVRLGGIYALEGIAHDSREDREFREHRTIVEVLSAFVREESKKQGAPGAGQGTAQDVAETDSPAPPEVAKDDGPEPLNDATPRPAPDVQAALTVLGRLPQRPGVPRGDLAEAQLSGARLGGADLSGAKLDEANLSGAQLVRANLSGAFLKRANLSDAQLDRANLSSARLQWAKLSRAELQEGANLSGARLTDADLSGARLTNADLSGARLNRANLSGAWLTEANLSGAFLRANLYGARLRGADLSGAKLSGADLRRTQNLTRAQLDTAHGSAATRLPGGLQRPDHWATGEESSTVGS
jgi:uncharacterized protein YjbI with pentapeptide repeats